MPVRYIGHAIVRITYHDKHGAYRGSVRVDSQTWRFAGLPAASKTPGRSHRHPVAYDRMAAEAVALAAFGAVDSRATEPLSVFADVAEAIDRATAHAVDERGGYVVSRPSPATSRSRASRRARAFA